MLTSRLSQRRADILRSRRKTYDIRDAEIKGFSVRILPSGRKCYFLHGQTDGNRVWHAIGDTADVTLECARTQTRTLPTSRRHGEEFGSDIGSEAHPSTGFFKGIRSRDQGRDAGAGSRRASVQFPTGPGQGAVLLTPCWPQQPLPAYTRGQRQGEKPQSEPSRPRLRSVRHQAEPNRLSCRR